MVATGPEEPAAKLDGLRPGSLDCYVQLPLTLEPVGTTVVGRVRPFLEAGLLTCFRLVEAVLPMLSASGRVVLVSGHTPISSDVPDDRAARLAFLDVLAHAVRADRTPAKTRVRVVAHDPSAAVIAGLSTEDEAAEPVPTVESAVRADSRLSPDQTALIAVYRAMLDS